MRLLKDSFSFFRKHPFVLAPLFVHGILVLILSALIFLGISLSGLAVIKGSMGLILVGILATVMVWSTTLVIGGTTGMITRLRQGDKGWILFFDEYKRHFLRMSGFLFWFLLLFIGTTGGIYWLLNTFGVHQPEVMVLGWAAAWFWLVVMGLIGAVILTHKPSQAVWKTVDELFHLSNGFLLRSAATFLVHGACVVAIVALSYSIPFLSACLGVITLTFAFPLYLIHLSFSYSPTKDLSR